MLSCLRKSGRTCREASIKAWSNFSGLLASNWVTEKTVSGVEMDSAEADARLENLQELIGSVQEYEADAEQAGARVGGVLGCPRGRQGEIAPPPAYWDGSNLQHGEMIMWNRYQVRFCIGDVREEDNWQSKKALKEAVARGERVEVFSPGPFPCPTEGIVTLEGPHYPQAHKWYSRVRVENGRVVKILS